MEKRCHTPINCRQKLRRQGCRVHEVYEASLASFISYGNCVIRRCSFRSTAAKWLGSCRRLREVFDDERLSKLRRWLARRVEYRQKCLCGSNERLVQHTQCRLSCFGKTGGSSRYRFSPVLSQRRRTY